MTLPATNEAPRRLTNYSVPEFNPELIRLPHTWFSVFDIDKTLLYKTPDELALAVHLLNIFGRDTYNFYSTICTQHLCAEPAYASVANLNWNVGGRTIYPPLMLEMGAVVAWAKPDRTVIDNFTYTEAYGVRFRDFARHERPAVMSIIEEEFPGMTSFEQGMVMIGARIEQPALDKYGEGTDKKLAKQKMKSILEARLTKEGLMETVWVMDQGADLDCGPKILESRQKMVGVSVFYDFLMNDTRYAQMREMVSQQRIILADDKDYAAGYPSTLLLNTGGGVVLPSVAQEELIERVISAHKPDSFVQAKSPRALEVVKSAYKLALHKEGLFNF